MLKELDTTLAEADTAIEANSESPETTTENTTDTVE
jgi:hypothetical protein